MSQSADTAIGLAVIKSEGESINYGEGEVGPNTGKSRWIELRWSSEEPLTDAESCAHSKIIPILVSLSPEQIENVITHLANDLIEHVGY